jgi:A/G-specific adenine glycosylase
MNTLDRTGAAAEILAWYDRHRRDLPWRAPPGRRPDPYHVWLSEIMLQQTTVAAVKAYFEKFVRAWPSVADLAAGPLDDVLVAWAGLGYYARARNLHACARAVAADHGGVFPDTEEALRALPGIGAYTAAAIAAIAFGRRAVVVDGNVERVMARLHALETPLPAAKPELRRLADALTPTDRPGDYAQAVMDLGATVCAPRRANCLICPWQRRCAASRKGIAATLPRRAVKARRPTRRGIAFWVERPDGAILLRERPHQGLLGGMTEIPSTPWTEDAGSAGDPAAHAPVASRWTRRGGLVRHTFTHFHLELEVWQAEVSAAQPLAAAADAGRCRWVAPADLGRAALPSVMRKIVAHVKG